MGVHERIEPTYDRYEVLFDFQVNETVVGSAPGSNTAHGVMSQIQISPAAYDWQMCPNLNSHSDANNTHPAGKHNRTLRKIAQPATYINPQAFYTPSHSNHSESAGPRHATQNTPSKSPHISFACSGGGGRISKDLGARNSPLVFGE